MLVLVRKQLLQIFFSIDFPFPKYGGVTDSRMEGAAENPKNEITFEQSIPKFGQQLDDSLIYHLKTSE